MSRRVSRSFLDPWYFKLVHALYPRLRIHPKLPPEALVAVGHLCAIAAAFGFAWSTEYWWAALILTAGVMANHLTDMLDGTHARATNQCRNGGELLDHFTDPLSYSYWVVGLAVSCGRLDLGLAGVICLFATALLWHLKAQITGQLTLGAFGATEIKTIFAGYGILLTLLNGGLVPGPSTATVAVWFLCGMLSIGLVQLVLQLMQAVREVNMHGGSPDTSAWHCMRTNSGRDLDSDGPQRRRTERRERIAK